MKKQTPIRRVLKIVSLSLALFQSCGIVIIQIYTKQPDGSKGKPLPNSAFIGFFASLITLCISLLGLVISYHRSLSIGQSLQKLGNFIISSKGLKFFLFPALLYTFQQYLSMEANKKLKLSFLYQLTFQCKMFFVAILSYYLLKKKLHLCQWITLPFIFGGLVLAAAATEKNFSFLSADWEYLGFVYAFVAAILVAVAGVYLERAIKGKVSPSASSTIDSTINQSVEIKIAPSIEVTPTIAQKFWLNNCTLVLFVCISSFVYMFMMEAKQSIPFLLGREKIFYPAYTLLIMFQCMGWLINFLIVHFADNIMRNYVTSFSPIIIILYEYFFLNATFPLFTVLLAATIITLTNVVYTYYDYVAGETKKEVHINNSSSNSAKTIPLINTTSK